jgi:hypothetical protein
MLSSQDNGGSTNAALKPLNPETNDQKQCSLCGSCEAAILVQILERPAAEFCCRLRITRRDPPLYQVNNSAVNG